jgi:hypothetical protein
MMRGKDGKRDILWCRLLFLWNDVDDGNGRRGSDK